MEPITTPVVFIIFNRPSKTRVVFDAIRSVRPAQLFIIADGPRNAADDAKCKEVRDIIETGVDWPCEIHKDYSESNLGPKVRISSGLDWVFSSVEDAIILEDDCVPDPSFFPFCQELLQRYRDNPRIMQIGGYNFAARDPDFTLKESYYFSNIGLILGWATWRRAWQLYDINISGWPRMKESGSLKRILKDAAVVNHYDHLFDDYFAGKVRSWDGQWFFTRWLHRGLSVVPKYNLVRNIGFDAESTNRAIDPNDSRAHVPVHAISFPLIHPTEIEPKDAFDAYVFKYALSINRHFRQRALWFIQKRIPLLHAVLKKLKSALRNH